MWFAHKHMQNADFGQILGRRASTKRYVTSRPMVRFSQTWYQKMRKTWKKKVTKRCVAICSGREAVADFMQGDQIDPPPPPVKIGLNRKSLCCKPAHDKREVFEETHIHDKCVCSVETKSPSPIPGGIISKPTQTQLPW